MTRKKRETKKDPYLEGIDAKTSKLEEEKKESVDDEDEDDFSEFVGTTSTDEKPKGMPDVDPGFEQIIETIYAVKPHATYEKLEKAIRIGENRNDYSTVNRSLDDSAGHAKDAHALYLAACLEFEKWDKDCAIVTAPMRSVATQELQKEKIEGGRNKQITDGDVEAKMLALYPNELRYHAEKRAKLKGMRDHLLNDAEIWKARCYALSQMLGAIRR